MFSQGLRPKFPLTLTRIYNQFGIDIVQCQIKRALLLALFLTHSK